MDTSILYPFGMDTVSDEMRYAYENDYSYADTYSLPEMLPSKHPFLVDLCTSYDVSPKLPTWWNSFIETKPFILRYLLSGVTASEYLSGQVENVRYKAYRDMWDSELKRLYLPQSPKLSSFFNTETDNRYQTEYNRRGNCDTSNVRLYLSVNPIDFLYMSNGYGWRSCQHYRDGSMNEHIPGNFYDTSLALLIALRDGMDISDEGSILNRTIVHLVKHPLTETYSLAVDRTYHNSETLAIACIESFVNTMTSKGIPCYACQSSEVDDWRIGNKIQLTSYVSDEYMSMTTRPFALPSGISTPYANYCTYNRLRGDRYRRGSINMYRCEVYCKDDLRID